jgi:hypothetical protein
MRVKAKKKGFYANTLIEPGQVFDLVDKHGIKSIPVRNSAGEIVKHENKKVVIKAESQFTESWMVKVKPGVKKTIAIEQVGKNSETVVSEKGLSLPKEKKFHNGQKFGEELKGSALSDENHDEDALEDSDVEEAVEAGADQEPSSEDLNVI